MEKYLKLKNEFMNNKTNNNIAMAKYMQNNFLFYGINSKKRKEIEKPFLLEEKKRKSIDWDFLIVCYNDDYREMQYFVLDCLETLSKYLTYSDVTRLEYFVSHKQWWDSIDKLDKIIGNIAYDDKRLDDLMLLWSKHPNIWYRRIAIDHQQARKENTNTYLLEQIIINNFNSNEFFINKAIGWSLREYAKTNPVWVKEFIKKYKCQLNSLSYKEANKHLKEAISYEQVS